MGKPYKLLALDMDGTLLNEQSQISDENKQWIRKAMEAGVTVCFATGRGYKTAVPFAEELGLTSPLVLVNGGEVWATPSKLLGRTTMPASEVIRLRELALRYNTWYWGYSLERVYNKDEWIANENDTQWLKFGYYTEDDEARAAVAATIPEIGSYEITNSHPYNIELNPKGVSKATGLRQVCAMLGIGMDEIVACGDSLNDAAMIREAGLGIAMGNAQEEVKRIADAVTLTNVEHGVAEVIRKYIL